MTIARRKVVQAKEGIYHCISRCVRRAYLHGYDNVSGKNFNHRKDWVRDRLIFLAEIFAIEVLGYALMCNHQHTLLRIMADILKTWSNEEVARRWLTLYPPRFLIESNFEEHVKLLAGNQKRIRIIRKRLGSISWFMKSLNEYLARRANKEDDCKGRFWEGRFKCQRLEDEAAVLACAVYIDLNPIRAKLCKLPEESKFTSAYERIKALNSKTSESSLWITPIKSTTERNGFLSIDLNEYLELLDATGRAIQKDKPGVIPNSVASILERLSIRKEHWCETACRFGKWFSSVAGNSDSMKKAAERADTKWLKGMTAARLAFQ